MFRKENEHVFPFELMEYFDLITVSELGDIETKTEFHEIVFREKDTAFADNWDVCSEPEGYFTKRLPDFPMLGKPVVIEIQRRLWRHKQLGLKRCKSLGSATADLKLKTEIKDFLAAEILLPEILTCQAHRATA